METVPVGTQIHDSDGPEKPALHVGATDTHTRTAEVDV